MPSLALLVRFCAATMLVLLTAACEGPNWGRNTAGGITSRSDWTEIEPSQLTANLSEVLAGLPLKDARRRLIDKNQQQNMVTITARGWAMTYRMVSPRGNFSARDFSRLGSQEVFETWVREALPQAKEVQFLDVIPVTHPATATRGFAATIMVTNQQDQKYRCSVANAGYGGPRLSETRTDLFRVEDLKSTARFMLCTTNASAASLHQRMQRLAFLKLLGEPT
jgi:hypothetical protein